MAAAAVAAAAAFVPGAAAGADTGAVRLPLEAYLELLRRGEGGAPGEKPPVDFVLTEAQYDAIVGKEGAAAEGVMIEARLRIEVLARGWVKVPVLAPGIAIEAAAVDGKPVTLAASSDGDGGAALLLRDPGTRVLTARLRLPLDEARGGRAFELGMRESAITRLTVRVPEADLAFTVVPSGGANAVERRPGASVLVAVLPPTTLADVEWRAAPPAEEGTSARIAADSATVVHFGDGMLRASSALKLDVTRAPAPAVTLVLPEGAEDVDVTGDAVLGHTERVEGERRLVDVQFQYPITGTTMLALAYEMPLPEGTGDVAVPALSVAGAARDHGVLALSAVSTLEVEVPAAGLTALTAIDPAELPPWTPAPGTGDPLLFAYRYHAHPYRAVAHIVVHEDSPVLTSSIDVLALTTVLTKEGKSITRALLAVRNNLKQFLQVELPAGHTLWSAFVAGRPVKPARAGKAELLLVPLLRSTASSGTLAAFEVELIYYGERDALSFLAGGGELAAPVTDVPVTRMTWDVHLPEGYAYLHAGGDLRAVERDEHPARGAYAGPVGGKGETENTLDGEFDEDGRDLEGKETGVDEDAPDGDGAGDDLTKAKAKPEDELLEASREEKRMTLEDKKLDPARPAPVLKVVALPPGGAAIVKGVLPVRVALPLGGAGTVLHFEKEIVEPGEPAHVRFAYVGAEIRGVLAAAAWPLMLLCGLVLVGHAAESARRRRVAVHALALAAGLAAAGGLAAMKWGAGVELPAVLWPLAAAVGLWLGWALATARLRVPGGAFARAQVERLWARARAAAAAAQHHSAVRPAPAWMAPAAPTSAAPAAPTAATAPASPEAPEAASPAAASPGAAAAAGPSPDAASVNGPAAAPAPASDGEESR